MGKGLPILERRRDGCDELFGAGDSGVTIPIKLRTECHAPWAAHVPVSIERSCSPKCTGMFGKLGSIFRTDVVGRGEGKRAVFPFDDAVGKKRQNSIEVFDWSGP